MSEQREGPASVLMCNGCRYSTEFGNYRRWQYDCKHPSLKENEPVPIGEVGNLRVNIAPLWCPVLKAREENPG